MTSLIPIIESGIIGNAKPIVNGETQVTWIGGTEWMGTDNLVAKVSHYVLGNQDDKKLQPAGDYLTVEDFDQVEISNFTAEKIDVREDGVIEMNRGSSIKVTKGEEEAKVVVVDGETEHKLTFPAKTGTFAVMEDVMDEVNGREVTWEDDLNYNDQASGFRVLKFKPRAFGMPSGRGITSITLTNSRSTATNAEVYIKLASEDEQTIYATSDSQNMDTKNKAYTFTFDTLAGLDADTEYHMLFFLAHSDPEAQQSVNLNLKSGEQSPDLYLGTRTDLRPKAVAVYKNPALYAKPFSGIPRTDLDSSVRKELDKCETASQNATSALNKITNIEAVVPAMEAGDMLASESFVNTSISTNASRYVSNNGEPFASKDELDEYAGEKTNNDYAFVVGQGGNKTYTLYRYDAIATPPVWNREFTLDCQSFTESQWAAIDSGITKGDVDMLVGISRTWEDDLNYNDQYQGIKKIFFKPRAFDMEDDQYIKSIAITNSRSVSTNAEVFLKLMDASGEMEYARSDSK